MIKAALATNNAAIAKLKTRALFPLLVNRRKPSPAATQVPLHNGATIWNTPTIIDARMTGSCARPE